MKTGLPICPENYWITSQGEVISKKSGKTLKSSKNSSGYAVVVISFHGKRIAFSVHSQVLLAFNFIPDHKKFDVNHLDGNKQNNCLENLEWCTKSDNAKHSRAVLGKVPTTTYKKIRIQNKEFSKTFLNAYEVADYLGVHFQSVYRALSKRRQTLKGFTLNYI